MSELNYEQLKKSISSNKLENLYLLQGEPELVTYFEKEIINKILGNKYTDFDISILNEESFSNKNLSISLDTFPMTTEKKCIIVKDIPWEFLNDEDLKTLLDIISDIPDFSVLVIIQLSPITGSKNANKFHKIQSFIKKNGVVSNFSQNDITIDKQLIIWAKREYNKKLDIDQAKKIVNLCKGYQIHEIKNELKKICEFEKTSNITEESLNIIWKSKPKISIFELPKALFYMNTSKCFEILNLLLEQNEEPIYIVNILALEYIDIYRVKLLLENSKSPLELAKIFDYKNKEFRIKNAQNRAQKLSMKSIISCLKIIIEADLKLKSTSIDSKTILSEMLILLLKNMS